MTDVIIARVCLLRLEKGNRVYGHNPRVVLKHYLPDAVDTARIAGVRDAADALQGIADDIRDGCPPSGLYFKAVTEAIHAELDALAAGRA